MTPGGKWMANTWQGAFPNQNTRADGYEGTAPVGRYPPNGYGLLDMIGNVWEWTTDWYESHGATSHACCTVETRAAAFAAEALTRPTSRKHRAG